MKSNMYIESSQCTCKKQQSDISSFSNNNVKRLTSKKVLGREPATLLKTCLQATNLLGDQA